MNRKLRHSLSALTASGAALAIALMVAVPATPAVQGVASSDLPPTAAASQHPDDVGALTKAVAISAEIAAASALAIEAERGMEAQATERSPRKGSRHRRQTIVMPYFSFLPRG